MTNTKALAIAELNIRITRREQYARDALRRRAARKRSTRHHYDNDLHDFRRHMCRLRTERAALARLLEES